MVSKTSTLLLISGLLGLFVQILNAHIRITWPPARHYALDFLDTIRTKGPCGMPKGLGQKTTFHVGEVVPLRWHLGYPHGGGIKIELLNSQGAIIQQLTPGNWSLEKDTTKTTYDITLPNTQCMDCTLRLLRQALEWGKTYQFWSCAEIDIVAVNQVQNTCSGKGTWANNKCTCNRLYHGDKCQFKDECEMHSDCGENGMCMDIEATSYPKKQCFCKRGWMGHGCSTASNWIQINTEFHIKTVLSSASPSYEMYHKVVGDELEVVLKVHGKSYAAVGWRPRDATSICQSAFPLFASQALVGVNTIPNAAELQAEMVLAKKAMPTPAPIADSGNTGKPVADAAQTCNPDSRKGIKSTGVAEPGSEEPTKEEPTKEEPTKEEPTKEEPTKEEPTKEPSKEEPGQEEETSEEEGAGSIHPMDCTDMVIGMARADYHRIGDYFTRDRSTPVEDKYWPGGVSSLTSVIGYEEGDYTYIGFRRKLKVQGTEKTDYEITDSLMNVIWARGQEYCNYHHSPSVKLSNTTEPHFYKRDELKYHGHGSQRGAVALNFRAMPKEEQESGLCKGEYNEPAGCDTVNCNYKASWSYNATTDEVKYMVMAKDTLNKWIGIGFSKDRRMADTDVVVGWVASDGTVSVTDRWATAYSLPKKDTHQDLKMISGTHLNGYTAITFTKKRNTGDNEDLAFTDTQCLYMFYAVGGAFRNDGTFSRHASTPVISSQPICIKACTGDSGAITVKGSIIILTATVLMSLFYSI